jgi:rubrerythrin
MTKIETKDKVVRQEFQCFSCGESTRRKPTENPPAHCPSCGEVDDWYKRVAIMEKAK